jgi:prepilin signal peptidase PulO-like enzyme (type II secretory pathway)
MAKILRFHVLEYEIFPRLVSAVLKATAAAGWILFIVMNLTQAAPFGFLLVLASVT